MKYLRFKIFQSLLGPFSSFTRKRRMALYQKKINLEPGMKILDVGGTASIWEHIDIPLEITCLNLPTSKYKPVYKGHHKIKFIEGDGCNLPEFNHGDFDLIFSNSVIEHVGNWKKQQQFANEILRLSDNYWVQTPCKLFPIEAHCGMPFWWHYPENLRQKILDKWYKKLPAWTIMIKHTTVIEENTLKRLFPEANFLREWFIFPKSIIVYQQQQTSKLVNND